MSVSADILQSWLHPARVMRRLLAQGQREDRALAYLMIGCGIVFLSSLPRLHAEAGDVPVEARYGGALFAWLAVMPLAFYVIAALSHIVARALGGRGSFYGARLALFWALLAAAPLWLAAAAASVLAGGQQRLPEAIALAAFVALWLIGLVTSERFRTGEAHAAR